MNQLFQPGPIITCSSSAESPSAIAVIRLTGFHSLKDLAPFFSLDLKRIKPRFAHFTRLLDGKDVIDEILLIFFEGPRSYTGESILELHVHGNPLHVERVLKLFCREGLFRLAMPGEFTYRAYQNKKLNLAQIEGLDLFLHAKTPLALEQGIGLLNGELHQAYGKLYDLYLDLRAHVELAIDFSDDVGEEQVFNAYKKSLTEFTGLVSSLYQRSLIDGGDLLSPQVVLYGPTNVGKSTLFNLLLQRKRAIVSDIAGTTRDYISEGLLIQGAQYRLVDTAGIRETNDSVESHGIKLSRDLLKNSFFKILVFKASSDPGELDSLLREHRFDLLVISFADHQSEERFKAIAQELDLEVVYADLVAGKVYGPIGPAGKSAPIGPDVLSGPIGPSEDGAPIGPDLLIRQAIHSKYQKTMGKQPLLLSRHRKCFESIENVLSKNHQDFNNFNDLAVVSALISQIGYELSDLIGFLPSEHVLNHLFSRFCIGK